MAGNYTSRRIMAAGQASGLKQAADLAREMIETHGDDLASSSLQVLADFLDEARMVLQAELGERP